jgi:hypothetical protein
VVVRGSLEAFNLDGRVFLQELFQKGVVPHHVIMNLPAIASSFLPALQPWRRRHHHTTINHHLVRVHCYCFAVVGENDASEGNDGDDGGDEEGKENELLERKRGVVVFGGKETTASDSAAGAAVVEGEESLGVQPGSLAGGGYLAYTHLVRWVSHSKAMVCVGFDLPPSSSSSSFS